MCLKSQHRILVTRVAVPQTQHQRQRQGHKASQPVRQPSSKCSSGSQSNEKIPPMQLTSVSVPTGDYSPAIQSTAIHIDRAESLLLSHNENIGHENFKLLHSPSIAPKRRYLGDVHKAKGSFSQPLNLLLLLLLLLLIPRPFNWVHGDDETRERYFSTFPNGRLSFF